MEIIPTILTKSYDDLKNKIALVRGVVPVAQIDICDGVYTPQYTWPFRSNGADREISELDYHAQAILEEREGLPFWEDVDFELDLMVCDAVENFDFYTRFGPKRVVFHLEAQRDFENFRDFLEGMDMYIRDTIDIGVAINTTSDLEKVFQIVSHVDFIQCMGVENVGFQGQEFDERAIDQIKKLREKFSEITISVDGSVNTDTAQDLIKAGADRLVIGSAIFKTTDIIGTVQMFENL
ncbi:MAG: hypothetical protein NT068_00695 [Candidatus Nomurabacteria bacterium]|nr:hypothetical protein [Candidatus Nomurabacteria bacterium]